MLHCSVLALQPTQLLLRLLKLIVLLRITVASCQVDFTVLRLSPHLIKSLKVLFVLRVVSLRLQLHLSRQRRGRSRIGVWPGQCIREIFNVARVLHQQFQQVFQRILVGLGLCAPIACGLGNAESPCGFITLIAYLFVMFVVVQTMSPDEI